MKYDPGGLIPRELRKWNRRTAETDHIVVDGACDSFCAFIALRLWGSCYTRNARLGFHGASSFGIVPLPDYTDYAATWLPAPLRDWFEGTGLKYRPAILGVRTLTWDDLQKIWPEGACNEHLTALYSEVPPGSTRAGRPPS